MPWRKRGSRATEWKKQGPAVDLNAPLVSFGNGNYITLGELLASGALICSKSGSGKSTAIIPCLVGACLRRRLSVVFTTAKPSDADDLEIFCRACGYGNITRFRLGRDSYNPLQYELMNGAGLAGHHGRLVETAMSPVRSHSGSGSASDNAFFLTEGERMISLLLTLYRLAGDIPISFLSLARSIQNLPKHARDVHRAEWRERFPAYLALKAVSGKALSLQDKADLDQALWYLLHEVPNVIPPRTLGSITSTLLGPLHWLNTSTVSSTVNAAASTWTPQSLVTEPGVLLLDCSVMEYGPSAAAVQRLCLSGIQNAVLRRRVNPTTPAVILVLDEAHLFIDPLLDARFTMLGRSQLGCMILALQSVSQMELACQSARDPHAAAATILAAPTIKIVGNTSDAANFRFVEQHFTETPRAKVTITEQQRQDGKGGRVKVEPQASVDIVHAPEVRGHQLVELRTGGPQNNWEAEAFVFRGKPWANGKLALKCVFPQFRPTGGR